MEGQRDGALGMTGGCRRMGGREAWRRARPSDVTPLPCRHRACNMFLESYKAAWILTEDHSFEDRMIDDLSVSWGPPGRVGGELDRARGGGHPWYTSRGHAPHQGVQKCQLLA